MPGPIAAPPMAAANVASPLTRPPPRAPHASLAAVLLLVSNCLVLCGGDPFLLGEEVVPDFVALPRARLSFGSFASSSASSSFLSTRSCNSIGDLKYDDPAKMAQTFIVEPAPRVLLIALPSQPFEARLPAPRGAPFPLLGLIFGELVDDLNSTSCDASRTADTSGVAGSIQEKVLLLVYISLANFFAIYLHTLCWSLFGERLVSRLRRQYFQSLLRQEMAFFDKLPAGEVPTRLTSDMEIIRVGTSEKVGIFISSFAYLIGAYIVAFMKAPKLAGMLVFMIPAYFLMVSVGGFYVGMFTSRTSRHLAAAASIVSRSLSNIALVHALGADQRLESKITSVLNKAQQAALRKASAAAIQFGFTFLVAYSANAVAFWQGSRQIAQAAEGRRSNVTAGGVYTVIFVLLD
ncbi:MAG: hypothetical protein Q9177_002814, partial [Variospora cf. flavescens]